MLSYEELRVKYKDPQVSRQTSESRLKMSDYCVGGAAFREMQRDLHPNKRIHATRSMCYPSSEQVAQALLYRNPDMVPEDSRKFGAYVVQLNDHKYFKLAWEVVRELETHNSLSDTLNARIIEVMGQDFDKICTPTVPADHPWAGYMTHICGPECEYVQAAAVAK